MVIDFNFIISYELKDETETYKNGLHFKKGKFNELRKYFKEVDWNEELKDADINNQYKQFCDIYKRGIDMYIPKFKEKKKYRKNWLDEKCIKAKEKKRSVVEQIQKS